MSKKPTYIPRPVYPGGQAALQKFIAKYVRYPQAAKEQKIEGSVTVRYSLDYTGAVVDAKIKRGLGYGCDEEALRVVRLLRFRVPQNRKKKVRIHQDLTINFHLPKPAPRPSAPATAQKVTYTVTPTAKSAPSPAAGKPSYGYIITLPTSN